MAAPLMAFARLRQSVAIDHIARVKPGGSHCEIILRLVERIDAIERLSLLDTITNLLEDLDACALVDRCTRRTREAIELQTIDAGDHAVVRCRHIGGQNSKAGRDRPGLPAHR